MYLHISVCLHISGSKFPPLIRTLVICFSIYVACSSQNYLIKIKHRSCPSTTQSLSMAFYFSLNEAKPLYCLQRSEESAAPTIYPHLRWAPKTFDNAHSPLWHQHHLDACLEALAFAVFFFLHTLHAAPLLSLITYLSDFYSNVLHLCEGTSPNNPVKNCQPCHYNHHTPPIAFLVCFLP